MTPLQELEVRAADIRRRFGEIGGMGGDAITDEITAELATLRAEHASNELRQSALKLAGDVTPEPLETRTSEGREFVGLLQKGNVGEIFHAAIHGGVTSGATAELQKHYGLEVRSVPLAMLITDYSELETRATGAPSDVGRNQQGILPYVFPDSAGTWLGVDMPSVPTGDAVFPILTNGPGGITTPAEGTAAGESTGTFTAEVLTPGRIQTFFQYSREDRARFAGMDAAIRENLSEGMSAELDKQLFSGTNGLLVGTNLANHNVTVATTWDLYLSQMVYGRIDGRYASMTGDLRVLVGADTYADMGATYRATESDRTVLDRISDISGGVRVSQYVPATDANDRQNSIIRRGMRRDMVQAVWDSIEIIPDEITRANEGEIKITAVGLFAQKILRTDGFYKQMVEHS